MVLRARKEGSVERKTGGSGGHEGERRDGEMARDGDGVSGGVTVTVWGQPDSALLQPVTNDALFSGACKRRPACAE